MADQETTVKLNGAPRHSVQRLVRLWCIHLEPRTKRDLEAEKSDLMMLARGPGKSEMEQLVWVCKAMCGIQDHRQESWATRRQRIMVFTDQKTAKREAQRHDNEYWKASVREVRIVEPNAEVSHGDSAKKR